MALPLIPTAKATRKGISRYRPVRNRVCGWRNGRDVARIATEIVKVRCNIDREELTRKVISEVLNLLKLYPYTHTMNEKHIRRRLYDAIQVMEYLDIVSVSVNGRVKKVQWLGFDSIFAPRKLKEVRPIATPLISWKAEPASPKGSSLLKQDPNQGVSAKRPNHTIEESPLQSQTPVNNGVYEEHSSVGAERQSDGSTWGGAYSKDQNGGRELSCAFLSNAAITYFKSEHRATPQERNIVNTPKQEFSKIEALRAEVSLRQIRTARKKRIAKILSAHLQRTQHLASLTMGQFVSGNKRLQSNLILVSTCENGNVQVLPSDDGQKILFESQTPISVFTNQEAGKTLASLPVANSTLQTGKNLGNSLFH